MMSQPVLERRHLFRSRRDSGTPALFLDRDGVLIDDVHYLSDPDQVHVLAGADALLMLAWARGWPVVVITNQSGISRGFFDWDSYDAVTERMLAKLEVPGAIDAIYANGYGPDQASQHWRKPNPGMLVEASSDLNIDLRRSVLVGDRLSDLRAGLNADLCTLIHVRTGHGNNEREEVVKAFPSSKRAGKNGKAAIHMIEDLTRFPHTVLSELSGLP
jgi:D-glycero-D-manno-heptose 1,7-bisphosphate phosphatase